MMSKIMSFIKRHPVLSYYILTFAISVGGGFLVMGPSGLPGTSEQVATLFPLAFLLLYAGPVVSGPVLTGLVSGRVGLRRLLARLVRWRVGTRWYVVAILTTPLLMAAAYVPLSLISPGFLPRIAASGGGVTPLLSAFGAAADDKATMVLAGLVLGVMFGFLEELGWTGFAIPMLKRSHGVLATGFIVGALWGAWHVPITFWSSGDTSGVFSPTLFLPPFVFYVAALPAYRVLMVWIYDRTESLLVATVMHASLIASTLVIFAPVATEGTALVIYWLVLAAALWLVVAAFAVTNRGHLLRQPPRRLKHELTRDVIVADLLDLLGHKRKQRHPKTQRTSNISE
jgi:membrane protease YdiL (CAAX protease family)